MREAGCKDMKAIEVAPVLPGRIDERPLPLAVTRGLTPDQQRALNHRIRRAILRSLSSAANSGLTAAELLSELTDGVTTSTSVLRAHLDLLSESGALDVVMDGSDQRYRSMLATDPLIDAVLLATEASDELPG
jgi:DNA-binding transcriptional ArsR family regulator